MERNVNSMGDPPKTIQCCKNLLKHKNCINMLAIYSCMLYIHYELTASSWGVLCWGIYNLYFIYACCHKELLKQLKPPKTHMISNAAPSQVTTIEYKSISTQIQTVPLALIASSSKILRPRQQFIKY